MADNRLSVLAPMWAAATVVLEETHALPAGGGAEFLRLAIAAPLVLFLPGYAVAGAGLARRDIPTTLVFSIGLSLALCIPVGLLLNLVGALSPRGWILSLASITVAGWLLGLTGRLPETRWPQPSWRGLLRAASFAGAVVVAAGAVSVAREGALAQRQFQYTEFWMVPFATTGRNLVTVGLANHEAGDMSYEADLLVDGALVSQLPPFRLPVGGTRTFNFSLALPAAPPKRIEAWLYRNGDRESVYRKVWVFPKALPATAAEKG